MEKVISGWKLMSEGAKSQEISANTPIRSWYCSKVLAWSVGKDSKSPSGRVIMKTSEHPRGGGIEFGGFCGKPGTNHMDIELPLDIERVKGCLENVEGEALYRHALAVAPLGPCLEIGSYCGKSTVYLGTACRRSGSVLYALDHHRGSEEHQPGELYHDPDLYDSRNGVFDSFPEFRRTVSLANLEDTVVPIVTTSAIASRGWATPLAMVFIDGGHSLKAALCDYGAWACHIVPQGILAIHDIFFDPSEGGQAPHQIWKMALASGLFEEIEMVNTLGFLRRTANLDD